MNIERLEMMRVMMERVVVGSWMPKIDAFTIENERDCNISPNVVVSECNLDTWATPISYTDGDVICGFSACAVGHACFDEEFRKMGWSWSDGQPKFDGEFGLYAAERFFDITHYQSMRLFLPESYPPHRRQYFNLPKNVRDAKMVADRIQQLITTGQI